MTPKVSDHESARKWQLSPDRKPESCCVCGKPAPHVSEGGDGITVSLGTLGPTARAHLKCAEAKALRWFGL